MQTAFPRLRAKLRLDTMNPLEMGFLGFCGFTNVASDPRLNPAHNAELRGLFPEPFDVFNHSGNFGASILIGAGITYLAVRLQNRFANRRGNAETASLGRIRGVAAGIGITAVTLANAAVETKYGISVGGKDTIDLFYGIAAGAFATTLPKPILEQPATPPQTAEPPELRLQSMQEILPPPQQATVQTSS